MFPRFRIVAVSMKRLQIGQTCMVAVTVDMIHRNAVVMLAEHPAVATAPVLRFEQLGESRTGVGMPSLSRTPGDPIAVLGAAARSDLDGPRDRHPTVGQEVHGVRRRGRGGKGHPVLQVMPGPFPQPAGGLCWVSTVGPAAELFPGEKVEPFKDRLPHTGAVGVRPSAPFRVELLEQGARREGLSASSHPSQLRQMCCDVGLGGLEQGFKPQAFPVGVLPRWVFPHAIVPHVASPKVTPRLGAVSGMAEATLGWLQGQADVR